MNELPERILVLALNLLLAAWLLSVAYALVMPLLPSLVVVVLAGVLLRYLIQRRRPF